jgi:hypothetical protein
MWQLSGERRCSVIVLLESNGIHFWCASSVLTRIFVDKGARIVGVADRAADLAHLVGSARAADELAPEKLRTN